MDRRQSRSAQGDGMNAIAELFGIDSESWMARAVCLEFEPDWLYPAPKDKAGVARAKKICAGCPVQAECAAYALAHEEEFGVWGGLSERERHRILHPRQDPPPPPHQPRPPCGTRQGYQAHWRRREDACPACKEAERIHQQGRRVHRPTKRSALRNLSVVS
jgi:WhiB family redox-sensing transcriptional regulator